MGLLRRFDVNRVLSLKYMMKGEKAMWEEGGDDYDETQSFKNVGVHTYAGALSVGFRKDLSFFPKNSRKQRVVMDCAGGGVILVGTCLDVSCLHKGYQSVYSRRIVRSIITFSPLDIE